MSPETLTFTEGLAFQSQEQIRILFGCQDQYLRQIRDRLGIHVVIRGDELRLSGEPAQVEIGLRVFTDLKRIVEKYGELIPSEIESTLGRHCPDTVLDIPPRPDSSPPSQERQGHSTEFQRSSDSQVPTDGTRSGTTFGHVEGEAPDLGGIDLFEKARKVKPMKRKPYFTARSTGCRDRPDRRGGWLPPCFAALHRVQPRLLDRSSAHHPVR